MSETTLGIISLGIGGTALYLFLYGMIMLGLIVFSALIFIEIILTYREEFKANKI